MRYYLSSLGENDSLNDTVCWFEFYDDYENYD